MLWQMAARIVASYLQSGKPASLSLPIDPLYDPATPSDVSPSFFDQVRPIGNTAAIAFHSNALALVVLTTRVQAIARAEDTLRDDLYQRYAPLVYRIHRSGMNSEPVTDKRVFAHC